MDEILQYEIHYTPSAIQDMLDKADYIAYALKSPETALTWYRELRQGIQQDLATFPYKYPIYHAEPWERWGVRMMVTGKDIVLYTIDAEKKTVTVHMVCTKGKNLSDLTLEQ